MCFLLSISVLCETFPNYAKETILSSLSDLEDSIGIPHFMTFGFIVPNRYCIIYKTSKWPEILGAVYTNPFTFLWPGDKEIELVSSAAEASLFPV